MSESLCIDSPFRGLAMPKSYSGDLRERVIEAVEIEGVSRREAAERFDVSVSSAVKWVQRWNENRSAAPKPRGGSVSPLEAHAERILALIAERPGPDFDGDRRGVAQTTDSNEPECAFPVFWPTRHHLQKKPASRGTAASRRSSRAPTLDPRARHA